MRSCPEFDTVSLEYFGVACYLVFEFGDLIRVKVWFVIVFLVCVVLCCNCFLFLLLLSFHFPAEGLLVRLLSFTLRKMLEGTLQV